MTVIINEVKHQTKSVKAERKNEPVFNPQMLLLFKNVYISLTSANLFT